MQIIVHTPHGVFKSRTETATEQHINEIRGLLENICESGNRFQFVTAEGSKVYFASQVVKNSVFELIP